jgi:hypothetical protein
MAKPGGKKGGRGKETGKGRGRDPVPSENLPGNIHEINLFEGRTLPSIHADMTQKLEDKQIQYGKRKKKLNHDSSALTKRQMSASEDFSKIEGQINNIDQELVTAKGKCDRAKVRELSKRRSSLVRARNECRENLLIISGELSLVHAELKTLESRADGKELQDYILSTSKPLSLYLSEIDKYLEESKEPKVTIQDLFEDMRLAGEEQPTEDQHVEDFFDHSARVGKIENLPDTIISCVDQYMSVVNPTYQAQGVVDGNACPKCKASLEYDHTTLILYCSRERCNYFANMQIEYGPPTYKESQDHTKETQYIYVRITRLKYWLRVIQGCAPSKDITQEEWTKINQVCDNLMYDKEDMSYEDMRTILGNLRLPHLYDYIPHILHIVCGIVPVHLTKRMEEIIRLDFQQVNKVFDSLDLTDRSSFISYPYFIIKSLQRRGYMEIVNRLKALKTVSCINEHDKIWRQICEKLDWEYISTDL